jgi:hypothetical protein
MDHISNLDLERYHLGMIASGELEAMEEHILGCGWCAYNAGEMADYVDTMRSAIINGGFDRT